MLVSDEIMNVEGKLGRYTREHYTRDMFNTVTVEYNLQTRNIEKWIVRKIDKAKDILKVFKNLEKQGFTITTVQTVTSNKIPIYNTEIGGIFNGNIRNVNILWGNPTVEDRYMGFKQNIYCVIH